MLRLSLAAAISICALAQVWISVAPAAISFCAFGSGEGQCKQPAGVAVDVAAGRVYVADSQNNRVNVFGEDGSFISSFGSPGSGSGQFQNPSRIAVDVNAASPNFHDVFVADGGLRIQRFGSTGEYEASIGVGQINRGGDPISVGPGNNLYVLDSTGPASSTRQVKIFSPAGALIGSSTIGDTLLGDAVVDSTGILYASFIGAGDRIDKYELNEPTAVLLASFDTGANTKALAVGPDQHLFAAQSGDALRNISERDTSGNVLRRFGYGQIQFNFNGMAVGASGALFGSEEYVGSETEGNKVVRIDPLPPGPLACCLSTVPGNTKATVSGRINPEGKDTTYHVDYITTADYVANGNKFDGPNPYTAAPESTSIGSDLFSHAVQVQIGCAKVEVPVQASCLIPNAAYRYRLVATNADGKSEEEGSFTSKQPVELGGTFATDVGIDSARLHALVNPLGIPTTGYFEYVDDAAYQADLAEGGDGFAQVTRSPDLDGGKSPINLGEGEATRDAATNLTSLAPATTYHYRFVVTDAFATETSPEGSFVTYPQLSPPSNACPNQAFRIGPSASLPDCRAYEMVSPVDKNGNDIKVLVAGESYPARLDQSSDDGNRFTYSSSTAFGDALSAPWSSQYLATREEGKGWFTHSLNPPRESPPLTSQIILKLDTQYKLFDPGLTNGWLLHTTEPALDECAPAGSMNLYRRDLRTGEYEALLLNEPTDPDAADNGYRLELQGTSSDGTRAVFSANTKLIPEAAKGGFYQVYEHIRNEGCGELRLVSYLPNGKPSSTGGFAGSAGQPGMHRIGADARAISSDGSRVFFSISNGFAKAPLYLRVNIEQEQSPVSGGQCQDISLGCTVAVSTADARFWTATPDGSKAIYSVGNRLFEFDSEKALAYEPASTLITEGLNETVGSQQGVAAASEDLSRFYFVSREVIDGEGEAGKPNLYLREGGATSLIMTLGPAEGTPTLGLSVGTERPIANGVRSTADARYLAFVTTASPTGYDNADAVDGRPNLEIHLYDAVTDKLVCVSCNPSGARPRGRGFESGVGFLRVSALMAAGEHQGFFPRALSADGSRLFFESFEALLPRDTNGRADVYEWQRASGENDCEQAGAELYVPASEGCLSLISTGQSPVDSEFADASPDGHDVFIRTQSSLLPQDDGLIDIYDVRVDGGLPQPPLPAAACEGEACQGPLVAPNDPTPASSAFEGAGNVQEPVAKRKAKKRSKHAKGKHRRKSKAKNKRRAGK